MTIAILGGGISGLTAAYTLHAAGLDVTVYEATDEPGGVIRSERTDGYLLEYGPNTLRTRSALLDDLIDALHLGEDLVDASPEARHRYIVREGQLVALPASPPGLLRSGFLSWRGKLRLLREPLIGPAPADVEESVAAFVRRRLGAEALAYGADPFVAGIFGGDPDYLSFRHAFPRLYELEQQHGSLLKGMVRNRRTSLRPSSGRIFSFREGLQQFPRALAAVLGDRLRLSTRVTGLHRHGAGWQVETSGPAPVRPFDAVVCTLPLHALASLSLEQTTDLGPLTSVWYAPIRVMHLGFRREAITHPLDGFGVLVPGAESQLQILGVLFSSTLFPDRAPTDHVLLTVLAGGARHPELADFPEERLQAIILDDLHALLGLHNAPVFSRQWTWTHGIPQYHIGYDVVKQHVAHLETAHPGLYFAGNYRQGIAVPDAMASGHRAAQRLLDASD